MKTKILILLISILALGWYINSEYKKITYDYNAKNLAQYVMFAPSVMMANVLKDKAEMFIVISEEQDPMDFPFTAGSKTYPDKVCSFQIRYKFPINLKRVTIVIFENGELTPHSSTKCKSLKTDAISSASGKT